MNVLDTFQIPNFPNEVKLGWSKVKEGLDENILSEEDYNTIQSFTNAHRKAEFLTGRHLFWKLINEFGWQPEKIQLMKEETGKPYIKTSGRKKYVSFSHSQSLVLCAVSSSLDIGLDVETLDRQVNPAIVKRILSENEWKVYGEEDPISLWTIKEAAVKRIGTGLRRNLKDLKLEKYNDGSFHIKIDGKEEVNGVCFKALNHYISIAF